MTDPQATSGAGSEQKPLPTPDPWAQVATQSVAKEDASSAPGWERGVLEKLAFAALAEQRAARRWRIFFRLVWLLLFAGLVWTLASNEMASNASKSAPHTAVVNVKGEIADGAEASAENVLAALRSAFEDQGSQAVVLLWVMQQNI